MRHVLITIALCASLTGLGSCAGSSVNPSPIAEPGSDGSVRAQTHSRRTPPDPATIYGYAEGDPTLPHVRGKGWYCYEIQHAGERKTYCHRAEAYCIQNREQLLAQDDVQATECQFRPGRAACLLVTLVSDGEQSHLCAPTLAECERFRMVSLAAPETYVFVSECEYID